jgi:hypothetical protein
MNRYLRLTRFATLSGRVSRLRQNATTRQVRLHILPRVSGKLLNIKHSLSLSDFRLGKSPMLSGNSLRRLIPKMSSSVRPLNLPRDLGSSESAQKPCSRRIRRLLSLPMDSGRWCNTLHPHRFREVRYDKSPIASGRYCNSQQSSRCKLLKLLMPQKDAGRLSTFEMDKCRQTKLPCGAPDLGGRRGSAQQKRTISPKLHMSMLKYTIQVYSGFEYWSTKVKCFQFSFDHLKPRSSLSTLRMH